MAETFIPTDRSASTAPQPGPIEKKPDWLKVRATLGPNYRDLKALTAGLGLHTICEEPTAPTSTSAGRNRTATFLILGASAPGPALLRRGDGAPTELDLESRGGWRGRCSSSACATW